MSISLLLTLFGGLFLGLAIGRWVARKDMEQILRAQSQTILHQLNTLEIKDREITEAVKYIDWCHQTIDRLQGRPVKGGDTRPNP